MFRDHSSLALYIIIKKNTSNKVINQHTCGHQRKQITSTERVDTNLEVAGEGEEDEDKGEGLLLNSLKKSILSLYPTISTLLYDGPISCK